MSATADKLPPVGSRATLRRDVERYPRLCDRRDGHDHPGGGVAGLTEDGRVRAQGQRSGTTNSTRYPEDGAFIIDLGEGATLEKRISAEFSDEADNLGRSAGGGDPL